MITGLTHLHSSLRWIAVILMIMAIVQFFMKMNGGRFENKHKKLSMFAMMTLHIQLVIGFALYFMNDWHVAIGAEGAMKSTMIRFFGMEHMVMMILGIIIVTFGYSTAKRMTEDKRKFKRLAWTYLIGFIIILAGIPWPMREALGRGWI